MKSFKKIIAVLFCIILVTFQIASIAEVKAEDEDVHAIYGTFSISLHHNIALSRYGVTVYLDGIEVAHLDQGDIVTFGAYMADNQSHVLTMDPDKYGVPDRTWTISNLEHGSVLTAEIQTKRNQVKVRRYDLSVNGTELCSVSPDIEKQVRVFGTIIATGLKIYKGMN